MPAVAGPRSIDGRPILVEAGAMITSTGPAKFGISHGDHPPDAWVETLADTAGHLMSRLPYGQMQAAARQILRSVEWDPELHKELRKVLNPKVADLFPYVPIDHQRYYIYRKGALG